MIHFHYVYLYVQRWHLVLEKVEKEKNHCKVNTIAQKTFKF